MVDRERFDSAARIELDGLVQYTFPHTKNVPGFHIAYRAVSLVGVFLALPDSTKRELLWLLNLYAPEPEPEQPFVDAREIDPADFDSASEWMAARHAAYKAKAEAPPVYVVEARLPDAEEAPPPMNIAPPAPEAKGE